MWQKQVTWHNTERLLYAMAPEEAYGAQVICKGLLPVVGLTASGHEPLPVPSLPGCIRERQVQLARLLTEIYLESRQQDLRWNR